MAKTPLFLLHGLGARSSFWEPLLKVHPFSQNYDVIKLEYPQSVKNNSFQLVLDKLALQVEREHRPGILMGHSLGGHMMLRLNARFPQHSSLLIQCSPCRSLQELMTLMIPSKATSHLYQEFWDPRDQKEIEKKLFLFPPEDLILENASWSCLRRDLGAELARGQYPDEVELITKAKFNSRLILSSHDEVLDIQRVVEYWEPFPSMMPIVRAGGAGHYAFYEQPEKWLNQAVLNCFKS